MVHAARYGIDRDAGRRRPVNAVGPHARHLEAFGPRPPTVRRAERLDVAVEALERDDNGAVRLDERLPTEALVMPGRCQGDAPRPATVGRNAHQLGISRAEI